MASKLKINKLIAIDSIVKEDGISPMVPSSPLEFTDMIEYTNIPENLVDIEHQIFSLIEKAQRSVWYIGKRLIKIKDEFLKDTGYAEFEEYVETKLGIRSTSAKNYMFVAHNFSLRQALDFGSKLYLLYPVYDKSKYSYYLEKCKEGQLSYRELEELIKKDMGKTIQKHQIREGIYKSGNTININMTKLGIDTKEIDLDTVLPKLLDMVIQFIQNYVQSSHNASVPKRENK